VAAGLRTIRATAGERSVVGSVRLRTAVGQTLPPHRGASGDPQATLSGSAEQVRQVVQAYAEAGVTHLLCAFAGGELREYLGQMEAFANQVAQPLASTR
jgi:hypothetical protein